jgi:hypothetical protein
MTSKIDRTENNVQMVHVKDKMDGAKVNVTNKVNKVKN